MNIKEILALSLEQRKNLFKQARDAYYNDDKSIMSDAWFNQLEASIKRDAPKWKGLTDTGAAPKKRKVALPIFMPSLDKIYAADVAPWINGGGVVHFILTPKFDGTSLLLEYVDGELVAVYTRGKGNVGGNITHLIPMLGVPKRIPAKGTIYVRCEGVMPEAVFQKRWKTGVAKDKDNEFDNARAAANGLCNRSLARASAEALADVHIIALALIGQKQDVGLTNLAKWGFRTAPFKNVKLSVLKGADTLTNMLEDLRAKSPYAVDGIVVVRAHAKVEYESNALPAWSRAFKDNAGDVVQAVVKDIIWQVSSYGRWTPKILIEAVDLGVNVRHATAHNAKWMMDRGIGPGAVVEILRAGDVIPKIVGVVKAAPKLKWPKGVTVWDGVHLKVDKSKQTNVLQSDAARSVRGDETEKRVQVLKMLKFCRRSGLEGLAASGLSKLYDAGFTNPVKLVARPKASLSKWEDAIGKANALKLYLAIDHIFHKQGISMARLLQASNMFDEGFGDRRVQLIAKHMPLADLLIDTSNKAAYTKLYNRLIAIHGLGPETVLMIMKGMKRYHPFHEAMAKACKVIVPDTKTEAPKATGTRFKGMVCSWTGYRSKEQEQAVIDGGGEVVSLGKRTTHLFYNPEGKFMDKVFKARDAGTKILVWK